MKNQVANWVFLSILDIDEQGERGGGRNVRGPGEVHSWVDVVKQETRIEAVKRLGGKGEYFSTPTISISGEEKENQPTITGRNQCEGPPKEGESGKRR